MAGYKSIYLANLLLGLELGDASWSPPATWYLALFTTLPSAGGTGGVEVTGGSYARIAITNDGTNFSTPSGGVVSNSVAIDCGTPSGNWGTIVGAALFDSGTIGAGNMYRVFLASPQIPAPSGTPVTILIGSMIATEA